MGVPSFYKWLVNKYPKVVVKAIEEKGECTDTNKPNPNGIYDNLYLDMNGIIHPCFHPDDDNCSPPRNLEDVFNNVFEYIDRLFSIVRPRKLLYMAIDGVAPRAKMNQQRSRRFRNAKDKETLETEEDKLRKQFEMEGKQVLPKEESDVWDSNIITPGTEFMYKLSEALQSYISSRMTHNEGWRNITVILSDANVPGEGEHKVMSFIRKQRNLPDYDPNTRHCLYGLDADLIMLAMATHEPHFSILREDVVLQENQPVYKLANDSVMQPFKSRGWFKDMNAFDVSGPSIKNKIGSPCKPYEFLHIWLLREYLELDMKIQDCPKGVNIDFERLIDDFIFMCFFAGNDFLPHMPSLEIHEGAIDLLMTVYKKEFKNLGGYLIDMNKVKDHVSYLVKWSRVEKFILMVGTYEEKISKKRSEIREKKLKRILRDHEVAKEEEENDACDLKFDKGSSSSLPSKQVLAASNSSVVLAIDVPAPSEIMQNTKELKEQLNKIIKQKSDLFKNGVLTTDKIKLGTAGWKQRYYKEKFSVESPADIESKRKEIVQKYTEGLFWVIQYYFSGVPFWTWFYPYHYGPFASDLKGMSQVRLNFEKGDPFKPFEQLLAVLPPRSSHALPKPYEKLMVDEQSAIIDFYPLDFEVDTDGKRYMWQGICKLPFIEEKRLLAETRHLEKELSKKEAIRNSVRFDHLFVRSTNKLEVRVRYLTSGKEASDKLDISISDGIGGFIRLCKEDNEKAKAFKKMQEDCVLCAYYELPVGGIHASQLLTGVDLPPKTIYDDDIMDTELWHERQGYNRNHFHRPQTPGKSRNANGCNSKISPNATWFSSNLSPSPEVIYRYAGTSWSSGRGRGIPCNGLDKISPNAIRFSSNQSPSPEVIHTNAGTGWSSGRGRGRGIPCNGLDKISPNAIRFSSNQSPSPEVIHTNAGIEWSSGRGRGKPCNSPIRSEDERLSSMKPLHTQLEVAGCVSNLRGSRPLQFVDHFKQFKVSDSKYQQPRPTGRPQFGSYKNVLTYQSNNACFERTHSDTRRFDWGRGRGQQVSSSINVNSWRNNSGNSALQPQVRDQSHQ